MSGGLWRYMSARTRRSVVFVWSALFVFSLGLQYLNLASPASVLAVHDEGLFELDGDATNSGSPGDDWDLVYNGTSSADDTFFVNDPVDDQNDDSFTGGSTKDDLPISGWLWKEAKASQAKNDIVNAFAAAYTQGGNTYAYFGLTKWEASGDNFVGFWFLKNAIGKSGAGTPPGSPFSGNHSVGDVLVLANYTNGGAIADFEIFEWVGSGGSVNGTLNLIDLGVPCDLPGADEACGTTNADYETAPWPFQGRNEAAGQFPPGTFFEGGINLTALGLDDACFTGIVAETRSSQSVDATLSDFALGNFNTCQPPTIETQVIDDQGASLGSLGTINVGETVSDRVTVGGPLGLASGTVDFFLCGPAQSVPDCSTGGTAAGSSVLAGGQGVSSPFTADSPSDVGFYCYRAEYTPAQGSKYLAGSHTNQTTECFQVIPAQVTILKTAGSSPVNAGDDISFTLSWGNSGPGTATGVVVTDTLPTTGGLDWTIDGFTGTGSTCSIVDNVLSCNVGTIPGNTAESGTVTVSSATSPDACGIVDNTGEITSLNDGTAQSSAQITVNCPDVTVTKTAETTPVNAGDEIAFAIEVENLGPGVAYGVTLSDTLPGGFTWSEDSDDCEIAAGVLSCDFGDLAAGETRTVTVSASTDAEDCATIPNTATVAATNEPSSATGNNSDNDAIVVNCPDVTVTKTADEGPFSAGDEIGFTVTISNIGAGTAYTAFAADPLPGSGWSIESQDGGWTLVGDMLEFGPQDLIAGASSSVHVVRDTTAEDCGLVENTVQVTAGNEPVAAQGNNSANDSLTVNCPDVTVTKTAETTPVNAGDEIAFAIEVENLGPGVAYGVTLSDTLPGGFTWSEDSDDCEIAAGVLSCDFGDLAAGETRTVTVSASTDAEDCATIPNTATVAATNEPSSATGNNSDNDAIVVNCPDVTVTKTADEGPFSAGDEIGFTVTISNIGAGTAYTAFAADPLPGSGWSIESQDGGWTLVGDMLEFGPQDLIAGASSSVHVVRDTTAEDCGLVENTVQVTAGNEPVAAQGNNSANDSLTVNCPDVVVEKTADTSPVSAGEAASFTIEVWNDGPGMAYGVTLTDDLPTGVAWTIDATDPAGLDCSIIDGTLSCNLGDLAPGRGENSVFIQVAGETDLEDCGSLDNLAEVSATNEPQAALGNNTDDASVIVNCPDLGISKTADAQAVSAGDPIGFTVMIANNGEGTAFDVSVDDTLPAGFAWTIESQDGGWSIAGGNLTWGPADLAAGATSSVHIVADTAYEACGLVPNTASIYLDGEFVADDSAAVTIECPVLSIVKTADAETVNAGDAIGFTITVSNAGPGVAKDVELNDPLPAGVTWTVDGGADAADCSITDGDLTCDFGDLAAGASAEVHVGATTSAEACSVYDNTATASASNHPDVDDDAVITCDLSIIGITKTADAASVLAGDPIGFVVTVTNTGAGTAYGVKVSDPLPAGVTWSIDAANSDDGWTIADGTLSYGGAEGVSLAAGASVTVHVTAPTTREDCGVVDNTATVTTTNDGSDSASASLTVVCPVLTLDKENDAPVETIDLGDGNVIELPTAGEGDTVTYTLDYTLVDGPVTDGVLTDVLPVGVEYVDGTAQGNDEFSFVSYDAATRTLLWEAATVTQNGTVSYDVVVQDGAAELAQPLVNVAEISSKQTPPDGATSNVFVNPPPQVLTPPPTDTFGEAPQGGSNVGFVLMLILLLLAGAAVLTGFVTPVPARIRNTREDGR